MELAGGTNERMVDLPIHHRAGDAQTESDVGDVPDTDQRPWRADTLASEGFLPRTGIRRVALLATASCSLGLRCGGQFDDVRAKEVAWDQEEENRSEDEIFSSIVVT